MNLKQISSSTIAILIVALIVLATGTYTDNGGFQLAGFLFLLVGCLLAFKQVRDRNNST